MNQKCFTGLTKLSLIVGASGLLALVVGCPTGDFTLPGINQDPTSNAGADRTIDDGQRVTLNALGSTDADDDALTFIWQQRSGPVKQGDQSPVARSPSVEESTPHAKGKTSWLR